jgi:hypothetical protein
MSGTPGAGLNPGGMRGNRPLRELIFQIKEESKVYKLKRKTLQGRDDFEGIP